MTDSWVWRERQLRCYRESHHLLYLRHPQISLQLLPASACCIGCSHLSAAEQQPLTQPDGAVRLLPLPWQFQQINTMCNNCFTSNSAFQIQCYHFIRLKFWQRQRETRRGHEHCMPRSAYIDSSRLYPITEWTLCLIWDPWNLALELCFSLQSLQIFFIQPLNCCEQIDCSLECPSHGEYFIWNLLLSVPLGPQQMAQWGRKH